MKILLDPQIFYSQKYGGVSRIFAEFWAGCLEKENIEIVCPLVYSENLHLAEKGLAPSNFNFLHRKKFFGKKIILAVLKKASMLRTIVLLKKQNFDVFVPTYYNSYFLPYLDKKPFVLTVFDMIHEIFPAYFKQDDKLSVQKKTLTEKAAVIISISNSTKKDILNFYPGILPDKIKVIYLSHSIHTNKISEVKWLPKKYLLFIGKRNIYKRFDIFAEAVKPLLNSIPDLYAVCAGGGSFTTADLNIIGSLNKDRFIQHDFTDDELYTLYANATAFVFPSEYEGFGIPVLEAMASGCPVVLSNSSSFPEVAEKAALFFEPNNALQLSDLLFQLLTNIDLRNKIIADGYDQAKKFSWQKTIQQYIDIIASITNHR